MKPQLVTSNNYRRPFRPLGVRAFNFVGGALRSGRLDRDGLLKAARRKTGLSDFGAEDFVEPLDRLLGSMNAEAQLTPFGAFAQEQRLLGLLCNRLRAEALLAKHPEILRAPLLPPIVIAGLQRTGTTMLHRLLAADPSARALASWEALNPAPVAGEGSEARGRRAQARRAQKALAYIAPEFFAIHPVEAEAPEEDILLLDLAFMTQTAEATMHVPSYARWLETQDHEPAYRYLRRLLLLLQWQRGGAHWVLKTPHHMEHLEQVLKVFPQARVIQTHRDPKKTMGSFCSMVAHGRGVFSDVVDPHEVANHWLAKVERMMRRSIEARARLGPDRFIDVPYAQLIEDPIAQVERIHTFAGRPFDAQLEARLQAVRAGNRRHKYGRHRYRLEDFGLEAESIDRRFEFYRRQHAIEDET